MNFDRVLSNSIIFGIFLIPFIPFIVANDLFFPFITGKNFSFRILTEILFGLWLILAFRNASYRPYFSWILASVVAFVGIVAVADLQGVNTMKSIWSNYERMEGLVTLVHLLLYFIVLGTTLKTQQLWTWFFNTTIGASVLMGFYGICQIAGSCVINQGGVRLDGKFGNATYLAIYMLFHIFITAIVLARWRGGNLIRYAYTSVILLQMFILYYTATRGAILGFIGGALLSAILIALFAKERPNLKKIAIGTTLGMVMVIGGFMFVKDSQLVSSSPVLSRFANISQDEGTRFAIWNMAWQGVKERPILGWGQENFNIVFNKYYNPSLYAQETWFDRVHNVIFDWLIAAGFLGLISYLLIPLTLLYYIWRKTKDSLTYVDKSLLTGMIAGYGFHNLFVFDNIFSYILFFTILAYVYFVSEKNDTSDSILNKEIDTSVLNTFITPIIIVLTIASIHFVNTKGVLASVTLIDSLKLNGAGSLESGIEKFEEALAYNSFGNQEIREQVIQAAARIRNADVDLKFKNQYLELAVSEMEKQIEEAPNDARHVLFLGSVLENYGQHSEATQHFEKAKELSPNKQIARFSLGTNLLNLKRYDEALALLKETVEIEPEYNEAHIMYAIAAIHAGNQELADQILIEKFGTDTVDNERLTQAYLSTGQYEKIRDSRKLRIENNPNDLDTRLSLAAIYLQLEQRGEAVAEIEKAIEFNPDFKEQGDFYIKEIKAGRNP